MAVIPFYGSQYPEVFAIERAAMDRPGLVTKKIDELLPQHGLVLDVGAGNGFTAERLRSAQRVVVPMEPAGEMIGAGSSELPWVRGEAARLPFRQNSFDGAYATWAYFFSRDWDPTPGVRELHRTVKPGGPLVVADNLGGDEFTRLTDRDISADADRWKSWGFTCHEVGTRFEFESVEQARQLLGFFFGEVGHNVDRVSFEFRVGLFVGKSDGPSLD